MDAAQRHAEFEARLALVEQGMREGEARFVRLEKSHDLNTRVTLDTRVEVGKLSEAINLQGDDIRALSDKVSAPLAVYDNAIVGMRMLGNFGAACVWFGRRWWLILAVAVACKVWWAGGSWTEVWAAITRMLTLGPVH